MFIKRLKAFFNPEQFQGWGKRRNYFEGWYFKVLNEDCTKAFAVIPGIAMDKQGFGHSFIQVLDGKNKTAAYHKFSLKDFVPSTDKFYVSVGKNSFSNQHLTINVPGLKGELQFSGNVPWPKKIYSPGIMGPYSFAPFMECYHSIVSMNHTIKGELATDIETINFNNGRGYIEKDWGRSFPSGYIWMQSNHFLQPGISLKASVAKIPWLKKSFVGFIVGLWIQDKLYRFTTYNGFTLKKCFADISKVELVIESKKYRLEILAHRGEVTALASPIGGLMDGRIEESMTSAIEVRLTDIKNNKTIFHDTGHHAGLEVAGKIEEIMV
jgi:tocopherol cyclase